MFEGLNKTSKLKRDQLVICRCPNWCNEGYQIATWNGEAFEYDADPNGSFNDYVIAFLPLNEDGEPCSLSK